MTYLRTGFSLTAALTLSTSILAPAYAQEGSGLRGTLSFSQGIELNDNPDFTTDPDGMSVVSQTRLGFGLSSQTKTETFGLNLSGRLEGEISGTNTLDPWEVEDVSAFVRYRREGARSSLTFSARQSESKIEDEVLDLGTGFFGISFGPERIIVDAGSVAVTGYGANFDTGFGSPLELSLRARYTERDYTDAIDPELLDNERLRLDGVATFRINPALAARASVGQTTIEEIGGSDSETSYIGLGLQTETNAMTVSGDLFFDQATLDDSEEDGIGFELDIVRPQSNGAIGLSFESRINESGRRSTASVQRSFELPTGGLSLSLGLSDQDGDDGARVIGSIDYTRETPRGGFVASLSQSPTSSSGTAYMDTTLSVQYSEEIDSISGWSAGLSYNASNELGGERDDSLTSANLTYQRALTEDWGMRTGVEISRINTVSSDRARNIVFFNIERDITFGF